jgi:hypothetical protein
MVLPTAILRRRAGSIDITRPAVLDPAAKLAEGRAHQVRVPDGLVQVVGVRARAGSSAPWSWAMLNADTRSLSLLTQ